MLALILGTYCVVATIYSLLVPLWEAPDEPSHYRYAQYVADNHVPPPPQPPQKGHFYQNNYATSLYEWYQPPLYYWLLGSIIAELNIVHTQSADGEFPPVDPQFPTTSVRLFLPAGPIGPEFMRAPGPRLARGLSVFLGICTLLAIYRAVRAFSPENRILALSTTGFTAFIPQFTFLTSYITNDNLADLLAAIFLLTLIAVVKAPESKRRTIIVVCALVAALGLIVKLSLLYALPLGLAAIAMRAVGKLPRRFWSAAAGCLMYIGVYVAVVGIYTLLVPGAIARLQWAQTTLPPKPANISVNYIIGLWPIASESFWGRFGWVNVRLADWIAPLLSALALLGLSSSCLALLRSRSLNPANRSILLLSLGNCLLVLAAFVFYNFVDTQPQGRYLYPGIAAFALLVCYGILRLNPNHRAMTGLVLVVLLLGINLIGLFGYLLPAYR